MMRSVSAATLPPCSRARRSGGCATMPRLLKAARRRGARLRSEEGFEPLLLPGREVVGRRQEIGAILVEEDGRALSIIIAEVRPVPAVADEIAKRRRKGAG